MENQITTELEEAQNPPAQYGEWLFAGADLLYAAYRKHYGQTFNEKWLADREWQVLLTCVAGIGDKGAVVNQNSLPVITDRSIGVYMEIARKIKEKQKTGQTLYGDTLKAPYF